MRKLICLTALLILGCFTTGDAISLKGKLGIFLKGGISRPWGDSYPSRVKSGPVFGGSIEWYPLDKFSLGVVIQQYWFKHDTLDLPNLGPGFPIYEEPISYFTDWRWTSLLLSAKFLPEPDDGVSPYFCFSFGWYHLRLLHTLVSGAKIVHTGNYLGLAPGLGLQFKAGRILLFAETDYNVIFNRGRYRYPEIWFNYDQRSETQFLRFSAGIGFKI